MTNALDYLTDQHQQVRDLFEEIERADEGEAFGFLETLADVLASHAAIEEQIFYPGVKRPETEENLADSVQEHDEMKRQLAELLALDTEAEDYRPYVGRLKELVMHHVDDEEKKLFPKVSGLMNEQDLETMGNELEKLYDKIQGEEIPSEKIEGPRPEL
jgi:hemerythrin superfamily protein